MLNVRSNTRDFLLQWRLNIFGTFWKLRKRYLALNFSSQICRLQRHLSAGEHQQDLFQSQPPMFVSQHSQPPAHSLNELIELCGGIVCKTVRQAGICIGKYSGRRPEGSRILSEQWVLGMLISTDISFNVFIGSLKVCFGFYLFQIASHIWSCCHMMTTSWSESIFYDIRW